jgi:hypothetical protein
MLPWFAANGLVDVRGHNVIWPGAPICQWMCKVC